MLLKGYAIQDIPANARDSLDVKIQIRSWRNHGWTLGGMVVDRSAHPSS